MKRVGKGFSRSVTPLFPTMVVQAQEEMGEGSAMSTNPHYTPIITQPSSSQPQKKQKSMRPKKQDTKVSQPSDLTNVADEAVNEEKDKLKELMYFCTKLQQRVLDLENIKTAQAQEITSLKLRVKRLEKKGGSRTHKLKRLYKVGLTAKVESSDDELSLEVFVEKEVPVKEASVVGKVNTASIATTVGAAAIITTEEITLAQALVEVKTLKPKVKGIVFKEPVESATTTVVFSQQPSQVNVQDKAEEDEEERLAREKAQQVEEANIHRDNVQAMIDADYQMAQQMQAEEQEKLSIEEKSKLFVQLLEARKKHFAAIRAKEKRNRPPTKARKRSTIYERVNTFVDMDTELVEERSKKAEAEIAQESSLKRTKEELEQESSKKQKLEEDKESEELKKCLEIVPDDKDDVTIEATPLSTKSPTIVDYKIYQEGKKSFFQIIRADGNSQMYLTFGKMLKNFDREDLEVLWSIVKARFKKTEPVNYMDTFLHLNLKTMFEHHVEDNVWKNQQGLVKVLIWKLYDSCVVHCVIMQSMLFYLLVEKMYPLTKHTLHQMFNDVKLQVDYECGMAFELLRLVKKHLKEGYGRIVGIKRLFDNLEVTAAKVCVTAAKHELVLLVILMKNMLSINTACTPLILLVQKLLLLVLNVNAAGIKVTTAERLQLLEGFMLTEKRSKTYQRKDKD
ncbi:hypothetical protein Tco_0506605 [Tanacetum coccineum]